MKRQSPFFLVNQRHLILKYLLPAFLVLLRIGVCHPAAAGSDIFLCCHGGHTILRVDSPNLRTLMGPTSTKNQVNTIYKMIDQSTGPIQIWMVSDTSESISQIEAMFSSFWSQQWIEAESWWRKQPRKTYEGKKFILPSDLPKCQLLCASCLEYTTCSLKLSWENVTSWAST